jgi:hypothetical protein
MPKRNSTKPAGPSSSRPTTTPADTASDDEWSKLSQREKFIRTAREVGADETGEKLDEALRAIGRARKRPG